MGSISRPENDIRLRHKVLSSTTAALVIAFKFTCKAAKGMIGQQGTIFTHAGSEPIFRASPTIVVCRSQLLS